ncbi:MAG: hypothetical protein KC933_30020 [Myxococcales bacterium]|nr:hypothetical protein [Myxococcales bacterium]
MAVSPTDPCFTDAAYQFMVGRTWTGMLEDKEITTEQERSGAWIHTRLKAE